MDVKPLKMKAGHAHQMEATDTVGVANGGTGLATVAADTMLYASGLDTLATTPLTAAGRALLDDADAAAQRTTLGLGTAATSSTGDFAAASHAHASADIVSGQLALARGGTASDLSATGGTGQFLRQSSAGAAITVSAIAHADLGSGGGTGSKFLRDDMTWQTVSAGVTDHGALTGLGDDDHTQYALLLGRSGGQALIGGTASGDDLTLQSTSHATRGHIQVNDPIVISGSTADPASTVRYIGTNATSDRIQISAPSGGSVRIVNASAATPQLLVGSAGVAMGINGNPARALEVRSTSAQIRLSYDASNNSELSVSSGGDLTITASGGDVHVGSSTTLSVNTTSRNVGIGTSVESSSRLVLNYTLADNGSYRGAKFTMTNTAPTNTTNYNVVSLFTISGTSTVTGSSAALYVSATVNKSGGSYSSGSLSGARISAAQAGTTDINTMYGVYASGSISSSGGITTHTAIHAGAPVLLSTGVITNNYGVYIADQGDATQVTTAYALRIGTQTNSATKSWAIGSAATQDSFLAGALMIGATSAPARKLHVISTSAQARFGYDTSNYFEISLESTGLTAGTTKTTPGTVDKWIRIVSEDGTYYVPAYSSTTA